ncbi:MAG: YXWGXW repeat-containing protein [Gammaproteobacteria bacterium]|nr:YXWGXW repeat-containing protein [Gammaproteobacteria bacterium]
MPRPTRTRSVSIRLIALAAVTVLLSACAAEVRVAPPVYVPPAAVVDVQVAPPPLPVYVQPPCPVVGWMWTPGYWAWASGGYYWVPGTWVSPPRIGVLWTPGYWGFVGGAYVWHAGYWGPHVGFYGGVHYGFGYTGVGYAGGRWVGGAFAYNRSVTNVNVTVIHNTYNETVVNNVNVTKVSYNGGAGGVRAMPTAQERVAEREQHFQPTQMQRQHVQQAQRNPALMARTNNGHPGIAATARPGAFHGPGVVRARGANERPNGQPANMRRNNMNPGNAGYAGRGMRRPPANRPAQRKHPNARRQQRKRPDAH